MVKFKFSYNFQQAELEVAEDSIKSEEFIKALSDALDILKGADRKLGAQMLLNKSKQPVKKTEKVAKPATDAQKYYLQNLGIEYDENITSAQAWKIINDHKEQEEDIEYEFPF